MHTDLQSLNVGQLVGKLHMSLQDKRKGTLLSRGLL